MVSENENLNKTANVPLFCRVYGALYGTTVEWMELH